MLNTNAKPVAAGLPDSIRSGKRAAMVDGVGKAVGRCHLALPGFQIAQLDYAVTVIISRTIP